jgi:hypothetical protein
MSCEAMAIGAQALPILGVVVRPVTVDVMHVDLARMSRVKATTFAGA